MTSLPIYVVDAFTDRLFGGNPAAVMPLERWLPDATLQSIAAENNLSETAFILRQGEDYAIRWFTPTVEVPLCGHATLASARVVLGELEPSLDGVVFHGKSGALPVTRDGARLSLDFPATPTLNGPNLAMIEPVARVLGATPLAVLHRTATDEFLAVLDSSATVRAVTPDIAAMRRPGGFNLVVTAPGQGVDADVDFVSRYFAPRIGIDEDPVTGGAHCALVPYWAGRLGQQTLRARQVSRRQGELWCRLDGDRVHMSGHAVLVSRGRFEPGE